MKSYNEYDEMFGESSQGYLVTSLPFSSSSTIIYANNRAASILELPSVSITGQTLGNVFPVFSTSMGSMDVGPFRHEPNGSLLRLFASPCFCPGPERGGAGIRRTPLRLPAPHERGA